MNPVVDKTDPVVIFSFDYPPHDGGISRLCAAIAHQFASDSHHLVTLTEDAKISDGPQSPTPNVIRVTSSRPLRELAALWKLIRLPRNALIVCGIWYPEGLLALLARRRRTVILAHGLELRGSAGDFYGWLRARLLTAVCRSARVVVTNSEYTARLVAAAVPGARVVAIPLGVDHLRFTPGSDLTDRGAYAPAECFLIGTVARLQSYKGHDVILNAIAALPGCLRAQVRYLIAGVGPHRAAIERRIADLGLVQQARFLGYVKEEELTRLYRAMDLFVMCTRQHADTPEVEGFGLVFLEAQACGTPVVGTRTGGIPDAIRHGEGGWLIEQDDVTALTSILSGLIRDRCALQDAGIAARRRVERECTWEIYYRRFLAGLAENGLALG
jgi:phosphatidylinositol alpha-1,6-mannosyltransferase